MRAEAISRMITRACVYIRLDEQEGTVWQSLRR